MRIEPICNYIAEQLHACIFLYNEKQDLLRAYRNQKYNRELFAHSPSLLQHLLSQSPGSMPRFTLVNHLIYYVHFQTCDGTYVIGPMHLAYEDVGETYAKHTYTVSELQEMDISKIPVSYPAFALELCLILFNSYHEKDLTASSCIHDNFNSSALFDKVNKQAVDEIFSTRENSKTHNSYEQEVRLLHCIETGNLVQLDEILAEDSSGHLGTTSKDPVRNGKNLCIYNICVCGRAAIRGGITSEYAYSLIDSYCQQVEEMKDTVLLGPLVDQSTHHFAQLVADLKKQQEQMKGVANPLVHQCKAYIFQHLHDKLTVTEIAEDLHVHPNYLSSLFHEQEGMSLYQYIQQQKIDLVKNLLTYSNYSYIDIANYLGYTSQSHLGSKFKAATQMTLKQYRDTYKKEEFIDH